VRKPRPNSANALYKVVVAPATATSRERATFFHGYNAAMRFLHGADLGNDRLYFRDYPDEEWEQSEQYEPRPDLHEVAITIHLSIHADDDLKAQNKAIDLIERASFWLLQHPSVDRLSVPLSPHNPRSIEPRMRPSLARKAAMTKASPKLPTTHEGDR
jgi:hypothetical protein